MANFRRRRKREVGRRGASSDWVYPQLEKGSEKRSRAGAKKLINKFRARLEEYRNDVGL